MFRDAFLYSYSMILYDSMTVLFGILISDIIDHFYGTILLLSRYIALLLPVILNEWLEPFIANYLIMYIVDFSIES